VVRASALALKPLAEERVIKVTVAADERVTAFADASRIRQVVDNLLGNAIKFNRDGGAVELAVRADGGTSVIEVRDTGVGIAEADRARVFERFFRASEDVAGNGLGLAISAEIVKARRPPLGGLHLGLRIHVHGGAAVARARRERRMTSISSRSP
jgi:signal transduction histidine kinase